MSPTTCIVHSVIVFFTIQIFHQSLGEAKVISKQIDVGDENVDIDLRINLNTNDDGNAKEPDMPEIDSIEEGGSSIVEVSKGARSRSLPPKHLSLGGFEDCMKMERHKGMMKPICLYPRKPQACKDDVWNQLQKILELNSRIIAQNVELCEDEDEYEGGLQMLEKIVEGGDSDEAFEMDPQEHIQEMLDGFEKETGIKLDEKSRPLVATMFGIIRQVQED